MPSELILLIFPWSVPILLVVYLFRCSIRSYPSLIACFKSFVVTSLCKSIKDYYYEYKVTPTLAALKVKINEITTELLKDAVVDELREVTKSIEALDLQFVKNETVTFCRNQM